MAGKRTMLTESLLTALTQAFDEVSRRVEQVTAGEGLSLEQWLVLRHLAEHGRQAIRELVAGSDPATLIASLAQLGSRDTAS